MENVVAFSVIFVAGMIAMKGCGQDDNFESESNVTSDAKNSIITKGAIDAAAEEQRHDAIELQRFLKRAKELDPNVVDAYYTYDEKGEKAIKVVVVNPEYAGQPASSYEHKSDAFGTFVSSATGSLVGNLLAESIFSRRNSGYGSDYSARHNSHKDGYCDKYDKYDPDCNSSVGSGFYRASSPIYYTSGSSYRNDRRVTSKKFKSATVKKAYLGQKAKVKSDSSYKSNIKPKASKGFLSTSRKAFTNSSRVSSRSSAYGGRGFGFGG